jgi:hypothetical protein
MRHHTPSTRDAALSRLKSANRWLIGVSVALTGVFTAVAANAFPGRTIRSSGGSGTSATQQNSKSTRSGSTRLRAPTSVPRSSEEQSAESGTTESESATALPRSEGSTEKPAEAKEPVEAERKVETQPEAPVVSGGS